MKFESEFNTGDEVYWYNITYYPYNVSIMKGKILDLQLMYIEEDEKLYERYNFSQDELIWIDKENIFRTKKQAEENLKNIKPPKFAF